MISRFLTTTLLEAGTDLDKSEMMGDTLADLIDLSEEELENVALVGLMIIITDD